MILDDYKRIRRSRLFRNVGADTLHSCIRTGSVRTFRKGELIYDTGDTVSQIGIVLQGELRLSVFHEQGDEFLFQKYVPPYLVGAEIAATGRQTTPWRFYCSAFSRIFFLPYKIITENTAVIPPEERCIMLSALLSFTADENMRKSYKINMLSDKSARGRILKYLEVQMNKQGRTDFLIPMNREEMASYLCLNRSVLSHELRLMETDGILTCRKNHFILHRI